MTEGGKLLTWKWPYTLPAPVLEGDTATYPDGLPGVGDLVVTATSTGFSHNIVLRQAPSGPLSVTMPIVTRGAELVEEASGALTIEKANGQELVSAPQPLMWDSSEDAGGDPQVTTVDTSIGENAAGTPTLTLSPKDTFLADPATVYPVTIDPSYSNSVKTTGDTWVQNADYTSSQVSSDELRAGTYDGGGHKARSFLHFNTTAWNGKHIISANLVLRNWYSGSCTGAAIRVHRIDQSWTASNVTWANQPSVNTGMDADYSAAKGYNSNCTGGDATWNVQDMVASWANGNFINNGLRIKAVDETSIYTWRKYRSANYGTTSVRPRIEYTYNSYPNKSSAPTINTTPSSSAGYSVSTTPTFKSTVSDPDGGNLTATFEVYQGTTLKWTGTSSSVASGSTASKAIGSGILTNGTTYTVKVKASDGTDTSKSYSTATTFTVDTSKPATTISASAFTNGQWLSDQPAANEFTFAGPSDTKSFSYAFDGVTQPTKTAEANGDATIAWNPKAGSHVLTVTATDKANNVGATSTFSFGVGPAAFAAPNEQARSTGVFPVRASAPPGSTGAELSWRYSGTSTWLEASGVEEAAGGSWGGSVTSDATGSTSPALLWDASTQSTDPSNPDAPLVNAPALLEARICFEYSGTPSQVCSSPRKIQLVPSAFGGHFPVAGAGPATVALFTGEATIAEPDAVDASAGLARVFASFDKSTTTTGAFGPGWETSLIASGATDAELIDNRAKDRTFVLVTAGGSSETFSPVDPNANVIDPTGPVEFGPAGLDDGSRLTLDGPSLTLTRPLGAITTWTLDPSGEWALSTATDGEDSQNDPEIVVNQDAPGFPTWIAQTEPGVATTCTATQQSAGCRGLKIVYTGTGTSTRVSQVELVTAGGATKTLAAYTYTGGLLTQTCGPDPDTTSSTIAPLCTSYTYDTTTVSGRTLLKDITPAGQAAWHFVYESSGRLAKVTRALDANTNTSTGSATWTIAYDLTPGTSGLPSFTSAEDWNQVDVPTKAYAVFAPGHVPSATPIATDLEHAQIWFTQEDGTTTNTAAHASVDGTPQWLLNTTWRDENGNTIQALDGAGRAQAMAAATSDERQDIADQASSKTVYSTDGTRVIDTYTPARQATLNDGTTGVFRGHTHYTYDSAQSALGGGSKPDYAVGQTTFGLVVETQTSASSADGSTNYDVRTRRFEYEPIVDGDGNGWMFGTATRVKTQLDDGSWSTAITRYDDQGDVIETRKPGGGAAADGSGNDAHSTFVRYYAPDASDADCNSTSHLAWSGLRCKTGPVAQPGGTPVPVTWTKTYDDDLQPTRVEQTSGNTTRVTTKTYDEIGRLTRLETSDGTDTRTRTTTYHPESGAPTTVGGAGADIVTTYDTWGRVATYTDADANQSAATYNTDGSIATFDDSVGVYTYTYDGPAGEHRGLLTNVDIGTSSGSSDSFALVYDARGALTKATYPNGTVARYARDEVGLPTGITYTDNAGETLLAFSNTLDVGGRVVDTASIESDQSFDYDALGRLRMVEDTRAAGCTTRTYGFNAASERTSFASYDPAADGACQTSSPTVSITNNYDAASRLQNTGYTYDNLGRTLSVPAADTAPGGSGPMTATYYANDKAKSLSQNIDDGAGGTTAQEITYQLDATGRTRQATERADGVVTSQVRYAFPGETDSPAVVEESTDGGTNWVRTRYIAIPLLGMCGEVTDGALTVALANLHGDTPATQQGSTTLEHYSETDEFGVTLDQGQQRYDWLGTEQRSNDAIGGMRLMGARVYNAATGTFLSTDPVRGGNATAYGYPTDPVNQRDVTGERCSNARFLAPFLDGGGRIQVPDQYCKDSSGHDWHDYCSFSADSYGNVSFKGPCAYHDMCLQHGWATARTHCDTLFGKYLRRNCDYYYDRHWDWSPTSGSRWGCGQRVDVMMTAVRWRTSHGGPYEAGAWPEIFYIRWGRIVWVLQGG